MKTGRSLTIDHMMLLGVLYDDAFYAVPALAPLRAQGRAAYRDVLERAITPGCQGCARTARIMQPIQDAVGQALASADAVSRDAFVAYVEKKRGYRPVPIVLCYVGSTGSACKLVI